MVSKLIAGIVVIVALAAVGTVGVAYYNDPTIFDSTNGSSCCNLKATESATQPASHPESSCCDSAATEEKSCCESKP